MPQALTIRQLPDDGHQALTARAAETGHSVEAEVRHILAETCLPALDDLPPVLVVDAYLTLALAEKCRVITADRRFADVVRIHPHLADSLFLLDEVFEDTLNSREPS